MHPLPKDGGTYWITHKGLRIQILYTVYEDNFEAFASFYYWEEESIDHWGQHPILNRAVAGAIENLMKEIKERGLDIWTTTRPSTKQKVQFLMFRPDDQE
ncbi:hypothetical protein MUB24_19890 [Lederbergia sp. NSJ-179]|uniref:hypothetical protein n=1 Tax=Lederbergia sp. NSJ-179 TaxID=2931402 RepID=UPI001FD284C8|nr:hypothetical protein [Lederbergia sp. NSJ-179]MCJ7843096.1 hypothetical protein [Lederbergia sp. NSJ-179]